MLKLWTKPPVPGDSNLHHQVHILFPMLVCHTIPKVFCQTPTFVNICNKMSSGGRLPGVLETWLHIFHSQWGSFLLLLKWYSPSSSSIKENLTCMLVETFFLQQYIFTRSHFVCNKFSLGSHIFIHLHSAAISSAVDLHSALHCSLAIHIFTQPVPGCFWGSHFKYYHYWNEYGRRIFIVTNQEWGLCLWTHLLKRGSLWVFWRGTR